MGTVYTATSPLHAEREREREREVNGMVVTSVSVLFNGDDPQLPKTIEVDDSFTIW